MMERFAYEENIDNFSSLSDEKCSYENANKFIQWLKPIHFLAKTELEDGSVKEAPEIEEVNFDDVEVDEVLSEADKKKIDGITLKLGTIHP